MKIAQHKPHAFQFSCNKGTETVYRTCTPLGNMHLGISTWTWIDFNLSKKSLNFIVMVPYHEFVHTLMCSYELVWHTYLKYGPLWQEFMVTTTGFHPNMASNAELQCYLCYKPDQAVEQSQIAKIDTMTLIQSYCNIYSIPILCDNDKYIPSFVK